MSAISRKKMEIQQREADILRMARAILLEEGYQALSMDRLASDLRTAKGTLYNHFPNKEEIVLALACEAKQLRHQMFGTAAMVSQKSRERIMAVGAASERYVQHHREHFAIEQLVSNSTIWGKSSQKRQDLIRHFDAQCMGAVSGVVRDAIAVGDLTLAEGISPEELVFGLWSITFGSQLLAQDKPSMGELGVPDPWRAIRWHCCTMLNGFNWHPIMDFSESELQFQALEKKLDQLFNSHA
jgi:AcrR family transcriptional regulator